MRREPFEREEAYSSSGAVGYCDHCGFAIYSAKDMLLISVNGDRIHKDCWSEYADEHMLEFAKNAADTTAFDCGL